MVEDCEFESNYIGLILKNADNNVNVINSAMLVSTAATESSFGRLRNDQMNQMIALFQYTLPSYLSYLSCHVCVPVRVQQRSMWT